MDTLKVKFEGEEGTFILAMENVTNPHWGPDQASHVEIWVLRRHRFYDGASHEVVQGSYNLAFMMMAGVHWASHGGEMVRQTDLKSNFGGRCSECIGCVAYKEAAKS